MKASFVFAIWICFFCFILRLHLCQGAAQWSFYGDGHILIRPKVSHINIPQSKDAKLSIELQFKTIRSHGLLLFLEGSNKQNFFLALENGRIKVSYIFGAEPNTDQAVEFLSTPEQSSKLNDLNWHKLLLHQTGTDVLLNIDERSALFRFDNGSVQKQSRKLVQQSYLKSLHVGDVAVDFRTTSEATKIPVNIPAFRGCLSQLRINGVSLLLPNVSYLGDSSASSSYNNNNSANSLDQNMLQFQTQRVGVDENCSALFDVTSAARSVFNFRSTDGAFAQFGSKKPSMSLSFLFELRTMARDCVVLYSSGNPFSAHFLLLKLRNGIFHVIIGHSKGYWNHQSTIAVSDGLWHSVQLQLSPRRFEFSVDGAREAPLLQFASQALLLGRSVVFGSAKRRSEREITTTSFSGCIRNISLEDTQLTLDDIEMSRGLEPGCNSEDENSIQCSKQQCSEAMTMVQQSPNCNNDSSSTYCHTATDRSLLMSADAAATSLAFIGGGGGGGVLENKKFSADVLRNAIHVNPVEVFEGSSAKIEWRNLYVFPQHNRFGRTNHDIVFTVLESPTHGQLTMQRQLEPGIQQQEPVEWFTYQDVMDGVVRYVHDGSEIQSDSLELEVQFTNRSEQLSITSASALGSASVTVPIVVNGVNDPPRLTLPLPERKLRLAQNSRLQLTQDHILITDPDTPADQVKVKILSAAPNGAARFELRHQSGVPLTVFSQHALVNGLVYLQHFGALHSQMILEAFDDGVGSSEPVTLQIEAFPVEIRPIRNTGVRVITGLSEAITGTNLSFATNAAPGQEGDIYYNIVRLPKYGFMELMDEQGKWWLTERFSQSQIDVNLVRYRHSSQQLQQQKPNEDMFKFQVSALNSTSPSLYEFKIDFIAASIKIFQPRNFVLNGTQKLDISGRDYLFTWTFPRITHPDDVIYHVTSPPRRGYLFKVLDTSATNPRHRRLGLQSNFSQADLNERLIYYKLHYTNHRVVHDSFQFRVLTPSIASREHVFPIVFLPDNGNVLLTNRTVLLGEGGRQQITDDHLHLETKDHRDFLFSIALSPAHGSLKLAPQQHNDEDNERGFTVLGNDTGFTTEDLAEERVFYEHDDSETTEDRVYLVARPRHTVNEHVEIPFWLRFKIVVRNDNAPRRRGYSAGAASPLPVFFIVAGTEHVLRQRDLQFIDEDVENTPETLHYAFATTHPNGCFYATQLPEVPLSSFTQADVNAEQILFRHIGTEAQFAMPFSVSDGMHTVNDTLIVNASAQMFFREAQNTGIRVCVGELAPISPMNLSMVTNSDLGPRAIVYRVVEGPVHGTLVLVDQSLQQQQQEQQHSDAVQMFVSNVAAFTQLDIDRNRLHYRHKSQLQESQAGIDFIRIIATAGNLEHALKFQFTIEVSQQENDSTLRLVANRPVVVSEGGVAVIGRQNLEVVHPAFSAASIVFAVVEPPAFGTLILDDALRRRNDDATDDDIVADMRDFYVHRFSQFDVNAGSLQYLHGNVHRRHDHALLNVSAGAQRLAFIRLQFSVVQNVITLTVQNLTVMESKGVALDEKLIQARSSYYERPNFVLTVVDAPKHGWIENRTDPDSRRLAQYDIDTFTTKDLAAGFVHYTHNGGPSWRDSFTLVAGLAGENLESPPATVVVRIQHINLKAPELIRNEALETWNRKAAAITAHHLEVTDVDTPPDELRFVLSSPQRGYVAFREDPTQAVYAFTQKDIDDGRVLFVHSEKAPIKGGFSFVVNDGVHQLQPAWFVAQSTEFSVLLEANNRLVVAPQSQTLLLSQHLKASATKTKPAQVAFVITKLARYGDVLLDGATVINQFTQQQINDGRVTYNQSQPVEQWVVRDQFSFTVAVNSSSQHMTQEEFEEHRFKITISYAFIPEDSVSDFIITAPVLVEEGGQVALNATHLNITPLSAISGGPLQIKVTKLPQFGVLEFRGRNVTSESDLRLTHLDIVSKLLSYRHIGSERPPWNDRLSLDVYPANEALTKPSKSIMRLRFQLEFRILPINNRRFEDPVFRPVWSVVRGYHYNVTQKDLFTDDQDTAPSEIVYNVVQGPTNGFFAYRENPAQPVRKFTQADVNKQRLQFRQDGTERVGSFKFQVSDGKFDPATGEITVEAEPLTLSLVNLTDVFYYQDDSFVLLNRSHLSADTNGPRDEIMYNVTTDPEFGDLFLDQHRQISNYSNSVSKIRQFSQADVDAGRIGYVHRSLETDSDRFEFSVQNSQNKVRHKWLRLATLPQLAQHRPALATAGKTTLITSDMLDATKLAVTTGSDPVFQVLELPRYGVLLKLPPHRDDFNNYMLDEAPAAESSEEGSEAPEAEDISTTSPDDDAVDAALLTTSTLSKPKPQQDSASLRGSNASFFSFSELRENRVLYISTIEEQGDTDNDTPLRDRIVFLLTAKGTKAARGELVILVQPPSAADKQEMSVTDTRTTVMNFGGHSVDASITPPLVRNIPPPPQHTELATDYTLVIGVLCGIVALAFLIVVIKKIAVTRQRKVQKQREKDVLQASINQMMGKPDLLSSSVYGGYSPSPTPSSRGGAGTLPRTNRNKPDSGGSQVEFRTLDHNTRAVGVRTTPARKGTGTNTSGLYGAYDQYLPSCPTHHSSTLPVSMGSPVQVHISTSSGTGTIDRSTVPGRMITFDPRRPEIVSGIPLCRVTPLTPKPAASTCSSSASDEHHWKQLAACQKQQQQHQAGSVSDGALEHQYHPFLLDRGGSMRNSRRLTPHHHSTASRSGQGPLSAAGKHMKLKDNQYWV